MTRVSLLFQVRDYRTRQCRVCLRDIVRGDTVKRAYHRNSKGMGKTTYVCSDCYVTAKGERLS